MPSQCMLLDPGAVPGKWHAKVATTPHLRNRFYLCRKTNLYKPPRAHYDFITDRLVLNFDHFCPWMVNGVGFYNRKFFILFLFWAVVTCWWFVGAMLIHAGFSLKGLMRLKNGNITVMKFAAVISEKLPQTFPNLPPTKCQYISRGRSALG